MSSCASLELLEHLASGALAASDAAHVQAHLESCPRCADQYKECRVNQPMESELRAIHRRSSSLGSPREAGRRGGELKHTPSLPGYRLDREIRRGAQGAVYEAYHAGMNRRVAIKVMVGGQFADEAARYRFGREVKLAANLKHPNIVPIHDSSSSGGVCFFVMDYIDGRRLDDFVSAESPSIEARLRLFTKIATAVNYAHQRGVIHRDLKPSNILVDSDGEPHILDFGLAKQVDEFEGDSVLDSLTLPGSVFGSLPYMSPEHTLGKPTEIDVRSDVYSLGVILFQMLTASFPYNVKGSLVDVFANITGTDPIPLSSISPAIDNELEAIVLKALAKEKDRRYQSAGALAADIRRYLAGEAVDAKGDSRWYVLRKTLRRYRVPVGLAGAFVVVLTFAAITSLSFWSEAVNQQRKAEWTSDLANLSTASHALEAHDVTGAGTALERIPTPRRGWVWNYLYSRLDQSLAVLTGHTGLVNCVAFSTDGSLIVSVSDDGTARVWETVSGELLRRIKVANDTVVAVAFDKSGQRLFSADAQGSIREWTTATGEQTRTWAGETGWTEHLAVSGDGGLLIASQSDGWIIAWNLDTGEKAWEVQAQPWNVCEVALDHVGRKIATGGAGSDGDLVILDPADGRRMAVWNADQQGVCAVAWSPDDRVIASAGKDGTIRFWGAEPVDLLTSIDAHDGLVESIAYTPDGRQLVSGAIDHTIKIWDAQTYQQTGMLLGHRGPINSVAVHPSGALLASGSSDGTVRIWRSPHYQALPILGGHAKEITALAFSSDGSTLATASADLTARFWTVPDGEQLLSPLRCSEALDAMAYSPDGTLLVAGDHAGQIHIWDASRRQKLFSFCAHEGAISSIAISPDGTRIASAGRDDMIGIWDASTGKVLLTLPGQPGYLDHITFNHDGTRLIRGGEDGVIRVWNVATGAEVFAVSGHEAAITAVACSTDGATIVTGSEDSTVKLWEADTGAELDTLSGHAGMVSSLAFSTDGRHLASASYDGIIKLWDVPRGDEIIELQGTGDFFTAVAFSPDGRWIAGASRGGTVMLWGVTQRPSIEAVIADHTAAAQAAAVVEASFAELKHPDAVVDSLRSDVKLTPAMRRMVLQVAGERAMDMRRGAFDLEEAAWGTVKSSGQSPDAYEEALCKAEQARALVHDNRIFRKTLGLALYRVGRFDEALLHLGIAEQMCSLPCESYPSHLAPLAMAQYRMGRATAAQETLGRLEALMNRRHHWGDATLEALFNEAADLIRATPPTP